MLILAVKYGWIIRSAVSERRVSLDYFVNRYRLIWQNEIKLNENESKS